MGPIEYAVFSISVIIREKYNDLELANEIETIASNCHGAILEGENGSSMSHPQHIAMTAITDMWREKYKDYMP